jgi:hypothetical protein
MVGPVSQGLVFDEAASAARHIPGVARGKISAGPMNGQSAIEHSIPLKPTSPRRVGIDYSKGQFVILDQHNLSGVFHGHVRGWSDLEPRARAALIQAGMTDARGRILVGPGR